ncbi:hypothetical protein ABIB25_003882 [Nakamurella sp. UYEF19]|uniref:hypothetical protein n=1 Tax=Nakamurella sp. UYEF19 TaxID=1756392 RepID=UPI00339188B6
MGLGNDDGGRGARTGTDSMGFYRQINGSAAGIRDSLTGLLALRSADEAEQAYWGLENWVVAQGTVYSSAEPTIAVLMASFLDDRIEPIKISALDLIYQVPTGAANESSTEVGNEGLIDRCRD